MDIHDVIKTIPKELKVNEILEEGYDCKGTKYKRRALLKTMNDLTNQRFGKLIGLFPVDVPEKKIKYKATFWLTQCDCGKVLATRERSLVRKQTTNCGCRKWPNLKGEVFGYLTVLNKEEGEFKKPRDGTWKCLCKCGNICYATTTDLKRGAKQSCGCYRTESLRNDYTGQKFYYLTAIKPIGSDPKKKNRSVIWQFQCDCGNFIEAIPSVVIRGDRKSCGCQTMSYGESKIKDILDKNNIKYIHDKKFFEDLITSGGGIGRYDFILLDENNQPYRLIEFDGEQHYGRVVEYWDGKDGAEKRRKNDLIKNQYAKEHNIPLVRIPYTEEKNITFENIMDDTFLIT